MYFARKGEGVGALYSPAAGRLSLWVHVGRGLLAGAGIGNGSFCVRVHWSLGQDQEEKRSHARSTSFSGRKTKKVLFFTLFSFLLHILAQYASNYPILDLQVLFANVYAAFLPFSRVLSTERKEGWNGAEGRKGKRGRERCPRLWKRVRRSVGLSVGGGGTDGRSAAGAL